MCVCVAASTHENVVGLDVGMQDLTLAQEREREEQLRGIDAHGSQADAHVASVALDDFPEVDTVQKSVAKISYRA